MNRRALPSDTTTDETLIDDLIGIVGLPVKDTRVKPVLARAGMSVAKKRTGVANTQVGIAYESHPIEIDGKRQLSIWSISFLDAKQKRIYPGWGEHAVFDRFAGTLPKNIRIGDARASVRKKLGKVWSTDDDRDTWHTKTVGITGIFARGKLIELSYYYLHDAFRT